MDLYEIILYQSEYLGKNQAQLKALLKEKLTAKDWKEANNLTRVLMMEISCLFDDDGYIYINIDKFPAKELNEIDRLWRQYSNSHFGFSVQKTIYKRESYQQFITNVGWYKGGSWSALSFSETAPKGHLPYCGWYFWQGKRSLAHSLMKRHSSLSHQGHFHQPHPHPPHQHSSDGAAGAAGAGILGLLTPAAPFILGAAAIAGAGYLIHRAATKEERERKERLEREEMERKQRQKQLEEENKVQKNIGTLFGLVDDNTPKKTSILGAIPKASQTISANSFLHRRSHPPGV
ncbi:GUN4 domain-containing protein [Argonema galeatum]|uniref:GUN4 domain-containing protein n=1 Tax=Argonema galeatum TaxID=2942762 RepID=UPI00201318C1|nr:GUN4 domain-containing protein [Argonema galeatum]MCL1464317.1 GUN4 domain-containing protein [Argonema galeatum A003/A1]